MIRSRDAPELRPSRALPLARAGRLLVIALAVVLPMHLASARGTDKGVGLDLLGAVINAQEVATLLVLRREKRIWVPIQEFAKITAMDVKADGDGKVELATPLGPVSVPAARVHRHETILYVDERFLSERLNFRLEHVASDAILKISPAWHGRKNADSRSLTGQNLEPEVFPPAYGVSTLSGTVFAVRDGTDRTGVEASLHLSGFAYDGVWQAAYIEDIYGNRLLRDFSWTRKVGDNSIVQLGHQTIGLHPLLPTQELSGVQWGWSSQPIDWSHQNFTAGAVMNRWGGHRRSFEGRGPIGGFAELWIDDRFIARRDIGLDGRYAFKDTPLVGRQVRVEVRLFDHRDPSTPVDVVSSALELSELLLDPGAKTLLAGAGWGGNVLDGGRYRYDTGDDGTAGFIFGRWGVTSTTTLEAAATTTPGDTRIMAGFVSALLRGTIVSGAVAAGNDDRYGYDASVNSEHGPWRLIARSFRNMAEADVATVKCSSVLVGSRCDEARWGHDARIAYSWNPTLEVGLVAQHDPIATFALPYLRWQPTRDLRASLRPDRYGDYRLDANYRATSFDHFALTVGHVAATTTYTRRFVEPDLTLTLGVGYDFPDDEIEGLVSLAGRRLC